MNKKQPINNRRPQNKPPRRQNRNNRNNNKNLNRNRYRNNNNIVYNNSEYSYSPGGFRYYDYPVYHPYYYYNWLYGPNMNYSYPDMNTYTYTNNSNDISSDNSTEILESLNNKLDKLQAEKHNNNIFLLGFSVVCIFFLYIILKKKK